jgi:hypothetical protein
LIVKKWWKMFERGVRNLLFGQKPPPLIEAKQRAHKKLDSHVRELDEATASVEQRSDEIRNSDDPWQEFVAGVRGEQERRESE